MSRLTEVIGLLYRMETADIRQLERDLLEARKRAWQLAIREQAQAVGCSKPPNSPRRDDLDELKRMSREDARSIARTWNREVERQIERLYQQNPRGNRQYFISNLERWAVQRGQYKDPLIALQTEQTTRAYTQTRFRQLNSMNERRYIAVGPPPTCKICVRLFGAGVVNEQFIRRNPLPSHVGCPHEWSMTQAPRMNCAELWVG